MIIALLYFAAFIFLIARNGFFGLFIDDRISKTKYAVLFGIKCLAIPVFYLIFKITYGGIENYDAGAYFYDSKIIQSIFFDKPLEYFKILFGFNNEVKTGYIYTEYISKTRNWDEGLSYRLFFNDNRSIVRLHSVFQFISFNSYFVHALFSCFLSFIGINLIYKTFKHLFVGKSLLLILCFALFPNLWLFSGALLKEPLVLFNVGVILFLTNSLFEYKQNLSHKLAKGLIIIFVSFYLKPQISIPFFFLFFLFKAVDKIAKKHKSTVYILVLFFSLVSANFIFLLVKSKTMIEFINLKQTEFRAMMEGGVFLKDDVKFVHLPYNPDLYIEDTLKSTLNIKIKLGAPFYYWMDFDQSKKHYCDFNADTSTSFTRIYDLVPANTGFNVDPITFDGKGIISVIKSIYYSLLYPISFTGILNTAVSLENMLILICLLVCGYGVFKIGLKLEIVFCISIVILFAFMFGIATPNTGAIVRYRSVVIPFLLLATVLTLIYIANAKRIRSRT